MKNISLIALFLAFAAFSCNNANHQEQEQNGEKKNTHRLPRSVGASSELLVVMNEGLWKGESGEKVREFFHQPVDGLPQKEAQFHTANVNLASIRKAMFKKHRNLFILDVDEKYEKAYIDTREDVYAYPQRIIRINTPRIEEFFRLFEEHKEAFRILFHKSEIRRVQLTFDGVRDITMINKLQKNRGIALTIPQGFYIAKDLGNFLWLRRETKEYSQGLMVRFEKYSDTTQFSDSHLIMEREKMTRANIPGPSEGSYMQISRFVDPIVERTTFQDRFAVEMTGLWEVEKNFMGGPFKSYTFVDEKNDRLITLDGFVFAPGQDKRDKLLQLEAMMKSIKTYKK